MKNVAQRELNYFQETFYRKEEVFPTFIVQQQIKNDEETLNKQQNRINKHQLINQRYLKQKQQKEAELKAQERKLPEIQLSTLIEKGNRLNKDLMSHISLDQQSDGQAQRISKNPFNPFPKRHIRNQSEDLNIKNSFLQSQTSKAYSPNSKLKSPNKANQILTLQKKQKKENFADQLVQQGAKLEELKENNQSYLQQLKQAEKEIKKFISIGEKQLKLKQSKLLLSTLAASQNLVLKDQNVKGKLIDTSQAVTKHEVDIINEGVTELKEKLDYVQSQIEEYEAQISQQEQSQVDINQRLKQRMIDKFNGKQVIQTMSPVRLSNTIFEETQAELNLFEKTPKIGDVILEETIEQMQTESERQEQVPAVPVFKKSEQPIVQRHQTYKQTLNKELMKNFTKFREVQIERDRAKKLAPKSTMELLIVDMDRRQGDLIKVFVDRYKSSIRQQKNQLSPNKDLNQNFTSNDEDLEENQELWDNLEIDNSRLIQKREMVSILVNDEDENNTNSPEQLHTFQDNSINIEKQEPLSAIIQASQQINQQQLKGSSLFKKDHLKNILFGSQQFATSGQISHQDMMISEEGVLKQSQTPTVEISSMLMKHFQVDYNKEIQAQEKFNKRQDFLKLIKHNENFEASNELTEKEKIQIEFINLCFQNRILPLPLVDKIKSTGLVLKSYHLTFDICSSISLLIEKYGKQNLLQKVKLINNDLNDKALNVILNGVLKSRAIKSLKIEQNKINQLSANTIQQILNINPPHHLEQLQLISCKTSAIPVEKILQSLQNRCYVRGLKIININLSVHNLDQIIDIIMNQGNLHKLDISQNDFPQKVFLDFLSKIENNQNLRYVTFSQLPIKGPLSFQIIDALCNQARLNMNLIHLDLSSTNLMNDEFMIIADSMKRSKSLLSVHLSGNQMPKDIKKLMLAKLKIIKQPKQLQQQESINLSSIDQQLNIDVSIDVSQYNEQSMPFMESQISQQLSKQLYLNREPSQNNNSLGVSLLTMPKNGEKIQLKERPIFNNSNSKGRYFSMPKDQFIFYRFLGHSEITDAYKWKMNKFCPVCERWQQVIFLYSLNYEPSDIQFLNQQLHKENLLKKQGVRRNLFANNGVNEILEGFKMDVKLSGSPQISYQSSLDFVSLDEFVYELENNMETHYQFGERFISSDDHDIVHAKSKKQYKKKYFDAQFKMKRRIWEFLYCSFKKFTKLSDTLTFMDSLKSRSNLLDDEAQLLSFKDLDWNYNQKLVKKFRKLASDQRAIIVSNKFVNENKLVDLKAIRDEHLDGIQFPIDEQIFVYSAIVPPGFFNVQITSQRKFLDLSSDAQFLTEDITSHTPSQSILSQYSPSIRYTFGSYKVYKLNMSVPKRSKELNVFYKKKTKRRINRFFNKDKSCFKYFKADDPFTLEAMMENDFKKLKYSRMVRDLKDVKFFVLNDFNIAK